MLRKALRFLYHQVNGKLDQGRLGTVWQKFKWKVNYLFDGLGHVPRFDDLIKQPHRAFLVEHLGVLNPADSVLEVGAGLGQNLYLLSEAYPGVSLHGVDISQVAIESGRQECARHGVENISFSLAGATSLAPLEDKQFKLVFSDAVLMYISPDSIHTAINEMLRVCSDRLVLSTWNFSSEMNDEAWLYDDGTWIYDFNSLLADRNDISVAIVEYPTGCWADERWKKYGALVKITRSTGLTASTPGRSTQQ